MADKIKIGLIGCGSASMYGHLPALTAHPDCELYAIAEVNPQRLEFIGQQYQIPIERRFPDYHTLLQLPEIQGVVVATRMEQHYGIVMSAAMAGKHIICERPMAAMVAQGWEMVDAARHYNVILLNNLPIRFEESTKLMVDYITSGQIGKVFAVRIVNLSSGPAREKSFSDGSLSGRDYYMEEGGGPILLSGLPYFDVARVFAGSEFRDISAMGQWVEPEYSNPGHVICTGVFENGVIALIEQSWVYGHLAAEKTVVNRMEVLGTDGIVNCLWDWDSQSRQNRSYRVQLFSAGECKETLFEKSDPHHNLYTGFAELIRAGKPLPGYPTGEDGIVAMETSMRALDECRKNRYARNEILREQSKYWVT